jgi:UDP-N-acetylglucosamine/UDP-N-acetylgalactosamine diphosphorylase
VKLAGGYFSGATFLDNSSMGSGAHVRPGTLLEEFAGGAHTVGLKQTVLFPYVVLGSLINFCDCLMAGGTSRKNHSEVGSSYVHFNYTPHQDKATPSLIGDVSRGVLLDQPPIFLGGQGGLVGPVRVTYGVIAPAGIIIRKDVLNTGLAGEDNQTQAAAGGFTAGAYRSVDRIIRNNLIYIGNIYALHAWYRHVRSEFMGKDSFQSACLAGALERLESISGERINRLDEFAKKMPRSIELNKQNSDSVNSSYLQQQKDFTGSWQRMNEEISRLAQFEGETSRRDVLLAEISERHSQQSYLDATALLSPKSKASATEWLQSIVDRTAGIWKTDKKEVRRQ